MHEESDELETKIIALNKIVFEMLQRQCGEWAPDDNVGIWELVL